MAQEATQKPYYMDENGNKVEYDDTWYIGDTEITISPMTEQETKDYMAFLQSCNKVYMEDEALLQIVQEERYLIREFGAPYAEYKSRVLRYLGRRSR